MRRLPRLLLLAVLVLATGCMSDDVLRYDGVTRSAGDAIAANTVMQMVDPWPRGVENPRLRVPADRKGIQGPSQRDTSAEGSGLTAL